MTNSGLKTFFTSFLDGFTGAGLADYLTVPGEPIIGFAPSLDEEEVKEAGARREVYIADLGRIPISSVALGPDRSTAKGLLRRVVLNTNSGKFVLVTESPSGELTEFEVDSEPMNELQNPAHIL